MKPYVCHCWIVNCSLCIRFLFFDNRFLTSSVFFFLNNPAPTEIYPFPLHAALPIKAVPESPPHPERHAAPDLPDSHVDQRACGRGRRRAALDRLARSRARRESEKAEPSVGAPPSDRKSTRLNSSHLVISYAVFCLKQ